MNFRKTFILSLHVAEFLPACFHTVRRLKAAPVLPSFVVNCSQLFVEFLGRLLFKNCIGRKFSQRLRTGAVYATAQSRLLCDVRELVICSLSLKRWTLSYLVEPGPCHEELQDHGQV